VKMGPNPKNATNTGTLHRGEAAAKLAAYIPFAVLCVFLLLSPIIPDVKLTRPKLLLSETSLYAILFLWCAAGLYLGRFRFRRSLVNIPVFLYAASAALFYFFSPDKPVALNELKRSLLSVTAFLAAANAAGSRRQRDIALAFLFCGSSVAVLYGLMQHYGGFLNVQVPQFDRSLSTFGNPIFFAAFLVVVLPAASGAVFYSRNTFLKFLLCCFIAAGLAALYFTGTRAAFIGLSVSAAVFLFLVIGDKTRKYLLLAALLILMGVFAFATRAIWARQQAHTLIWRDTLTMWSHHPFFGTGPGTFHIYFPQYASGELRAIWPEERNIINDAHNEYIQYLSETGIAGFGVFLLLLAALIKNASDIAKNTARGERYLLAGLISGGAGLLAQNMFSVDMRFIISAVYFFVTAGLIETFRDDFVTVEGIAPVARAGGLLLCAALAVLTFQKVLEPYIAEKKVASTPDFFDEKIVEPAKTITELEALAARYPDRPQIYEKLGWVYSKEKNWSRAVEALQKAAALDPKNAGPLNNLGNIYFLVGDRENAIKFWNRSLAINPGQVDSRLNLATAYYYKGRLKEASDQLREVLKIDPHNKNALVMLKQMTE